MKKLYLSRVRARGTYVCAACGDPIPRRQVYWRHDPHPFARMQRGETARHFCLHCVPDQHPNAVGKRRLIMPFVRLLRQDDASPLIEPVTVRLYGASAQMLSALDADPELIHGLSPEQFEDFVCDRLFAMGLEPKRVGSTNQRDGGIDIIFWPRSPSPFPFLGAAQVKHRRARAKSEGPSVVREFAGALAGHPFAFGVLVTNATFTPSARWDALRRGGQIRLRDFEDVRRWVHGSFSGEEHWCEIPQELEVCPGVVVRIRE